MELTQPSLPLNLLRELRSMIYRRLLTTHYAFDGSDTRFPEYHMHPDILFVDNRQILEEALNENYFVVLEVDNKVRGRSNWFSPRSIPHIDNLSIHGSFVETPVFYIRIREDITGNESLEDLDALDEHKICYLTGPEAIPYIIDLLRDNTIELNKNERSRIPLTSMAIDMTLIAESFPHRKEELERILVKPFLLISGLRDITLFVSAAGPGDLSFDPNQLNAPPEPREARELMLLYHKEGQEAYNAGKYREACKSWYQLEHYRTWIGTLVTNNRLVMTLPQRGRPLVRLLRNTFPLLLEAFLGQAKALIHLDERMVAEPLAYIGQVFAEEFGARRSVVYGKLVLCESIARLAEYNFTPERRMYTSLRAMVGFSQDPQYPSMFRRMLKEYYWAQAAFPSTSEEFRQHLSRLYWQVLERPDSLAETTWKPLRQREAVRKELTIRNDSMENNRAVLRRAYGW